ncbi:MAG: hypothetical protein HeimC3_08110 [Candidatus Heimdallarchaeota archaeon LC_3]|nr:MAG: hypothetical protein HeimC3_08110 [Candidatus Heimdallarchaeota archaeon LC_3]
MINNKNNHFELYDLQIVVERIDGNCTCNMRVGDKFFLKGGKISFPEGQDFCLYALQSAIPLLPAKQRKNDPADWMESDNEVTCPDPVCKLIMNIQRGKISKFNHDEVSIKPKKNNES